MIDDELRDRLDKALELLEKLQRRAAEDGMFAAAKDRATQEALEAAKAYANAPRTS